MDFITDQNPTALFEVGIKSGDKLPDYVKEATILQVEDVVSLANVAFADAGNRLYPIHTKAATYMSLVHMAGKGMQDTPEFFNAKQAAAFFDIEQDIDFALSLLPTVEKCASSNLTSDKYALTFQIDDESTWESYPVNTDVEVTKAATEVIRDWVDGHIPTDWMYHAAVNIVKQANALNIDRQEIPDRIWEMGEERLVDFAYAAEVANTRKSANVSNVDEYLDSVKQAEEGKISVDAAIDQWMTLDTVNGVNHRSATTPHEAFYSGIKIANVEKLAHAGVMLSDVLVPVQEILKLAADKGALIKMAFRKEAADNIIAIVDNLQSQQAIGKNNEKAAALASASFSKLPEVHRKEILNILLQVA